MNNNLKSLVAKSTGQRHPKYLSATDLSVHEHSVKLDLYTEYKVEMCLGTKYRIDHAVSSPEAEKDCREIALRSLNSSLYDGFLSTIDRCLHAANNGDNRACMELLMDLRNEVVGK